ncbi:MAG: hypothetical protein SFW35_10235 [Chitinophagales bacterium]|nr:hypothetical protein [Chitinophagales bacterium]
MRDQVWRIMINLRFKTYCLGLLVSKFQKNERNISIFLAVASSTSIAAWAVWDVTPKLWAGIIAMSQIITVIKPYFPFSKYIKELNAKCLKAELLMLEFENLWHKTESKKNTEDETSEVFFKLRKEMTDVFSFGDDIIFEIGTSIEERANAKTKSYLFNNYGIED